MLSASGVPRRHRTGGARWRDRANKGRRSGADQHPSSPRRTAFSLRSNGNLTPVSSTGTAAGRIVRRVARQRNRGGSLANRAPGPLALQLSPERAFVLHLDARAQPPRRMLGRIEHVTSGRIARISSLSGLTTFLRDVLRDAAES